MTNANMCLTSFPTRSLLIRSHSGYAPFSASRCSCIKFTPNIGSFGGHESHVSCLAVTLRTRAQWLWEGSNDDVTCHTTWNSRHPPPRSLVENYAYTLPRRQRVHLAHFGALAKFWLPIVIVLVLPDSFAGVDTVCLWLRGRRECLGTVGAIMSYNVEC